MKKIFLFIAAAMTVCLSSCSDDDCDHKTSGGNSDSALSLAGSWYNEPLNEEDSYSENGTFYARYANVESCGQSEGRWELDSKNMSLTWTYAFIGQTQFIDWKVKNFKELGFTISSDKNGTHEYGKIVETYTLNVGETAAIQFSANYPDYTVYSYTSKNERIASVSADGLIKAEGEKGTTYIKIATSDGNAWAKVIVGDNCADLWCDYVSIIGLDYTGMANTLRVLGSPGNGDDGYSFVYQWQSHNIIDHINVFLCPKDGLVTEMQLVLKDGVPEAEVLGYMNSRYYKQSESDEYIIYSTLEDLQASKAVVAYDRTKKMVLILETQHFLGNVHVEDLWTDFTPLFGKGKETVKTEMGKLGNSFLMTDYSYSKNGSDYYSIAGNDYTNMVGFVFNPDDQVSEYWVYLQLSSDPNVIYSNLRARYNEDEAESDDYHLVFYDEGKTMKVVLDLMSAAVVYTNLTMKQHEANTNTDVFGTYWEGLGLTHDQITAKYGAPYQEEDGMMYYIVGTDYVNLAAFKVDATSQKCTRSFITIKESVEETTVVDYFNSKFNKFANGTAADGSQYAWIDGATVAESTVGVIYFPNDRMVVYQPLGTASSAKAARTMAVGANGYRQMVVKTEAYQNRVRKMAGELKAEKAVSLQQLMRKARR